MKVKRIFGTALSLCLLLPFSACTGGGESAESGEKETAFYEFRFETDLAEKSADRYPAAGGGNTYYVSSKGSDENDGLSEETPIRTIKKVNGLQLKAGDTVRFKGGETFSGATLTVSASGTQDAPVTFCGYGDETARPKIVAQKVDGINFFNSSNLVIRDLEIVVVGDERVSEAVSRSVVGIEGSYTSKEGCENVYIVNNLIYGAYNTATSGIRVTSSYTFAEGAEDVLKNVHIENNEVHSLGIAGIYVDGWLSDINKMNASPRLYSEVYVNENTVYNIGQIAIYEECCHDSEMNRNLVHDAAIFDKPFLSIGQTGIMALGCEDTDIMNNIVYNVSNACQPFDGMGIDIDWNTNRINVQYNWVYDCVGSGVGTMAKQNCFIRNNRIENNRCEGNQHGQIHVSDFTTRYEAVAEDRHAVTNLTVKDNLIVSDKEGKSHFNANELGGDSTLWAGNTFENNRLVSNTKTNDIWIQVSSAVAWHKFAQNRYYKENTSKFTAFDTTPQEKINEGALAYDGTGFEAWKKRDTGAVFQTLSGAKPTLPKNVCAVYEDGKVTLTWEKPSGEVWHYNVYLTQENEEISYLNLSGEAFSETFTQEFEAKGVYYLAVEPESNQGHCGEVVRVKIVLE